MEESDERGRRAEWKPGPGPQGGEAHEWLALGDDELLQRIEALGPDHAQDQALMAVVRSHRHFFIRQEAAKRVCHQDLLQAHPEDRHVGQILVRRMTRQEDITYLERLVTGSRYLEVRKAAEAQLLQVRERHRKP